MVRDIMLGSDVEVCGDNIGREKPICSSCAALRERVKELEEFADNLMEALFSAAEVSVDVNNKWIALKEVWQIKRAVIKEGRDE